MIAFSSQTCFGISSLIWFLYVGVDHDQEPADQSLHGFQKCYEVANTVVIGRNMVNAIKTSISIILPTHIHEDINPTGPRFILYESSVYPDKLLMKLEPTDQDPHCFLSD